MQEIGSQRNIFPFFSRNVTLTSLFLHVPNCASESKLDSNKLYKQRILFIITH